MSDARLILSVAPWLYEDPPKRAKQLEEFAARSGWAVYDSLLDVVRLWSNCGLEPYKYFGYMGRSKIAYHWGCCRECGSLLEMIATPWLTFKRPYLFRKNGKAHEIYRGIDCFFPERVAEMGMELWCPRVLYQWDSYYEAWFKQLIRYGYVETVLPRVMIPARHVLFAHDQENDRRYWVGHGVRCLPMGFTVGSFERACLKLKPIYFREEGDFDP